MSKSIAIADVAYVHRITVGNNNPNSMKTEDEIAEQMEQVNKCLSKSPKGRIIGIEKSFGIYQVGEHQMVLQSMTYHIGFERKPVWMD